ncbi:ABC transporter substrate-binding protein [Sulfitobacter sp. 1A15106]|uniref:ABC transporter substrate-binding protein n=1 Tax=Sulfitobacter sp. 1A15106 TaxID=3368590 RepID=UPI003745765F
MKYIKQMGFALAALAAPLTAQAEQEFNEALNARLPADIREAGKMIAVTNGSFPPYEFVEGRKHTGATPELAQEIAQILGVEITHATVAGLPALLSGIGADRYQFSMGPVGDFPKRRDANDFVDWVQEYVVFAVQAGNPQGIVDLDSTCGKRIAVMSGGSAERVINAQSEKCQSADKPAIEVQSYADQPSSILSVRSDRADAFFSSQAPLTYFVQQSDGALELSGVGQSNGFPSLVQGAVVPKNSPLGGVLQEAFQILMDNGTYEEIMTKWGLEHNMIDAAGFNLGEEL